MRLDEFTSQSDFINRNKLIVETYQKVAECIRRLEQGSTNEIYKVNLDLNSFNQGITKLDVSAETLLQILRSCKNCYQQRLENSGITDD